MATGTKSTNLDQLALADELIANRGGSVGRIHMDNVGTQLAYSGPIAERLAGIQAMQSVGIKARSPVHVAPQYGLGFGVPAPEIDGRVMQPGDSMLLMMQGDGVTVTDAGNYLTDSPSNGVYIWQSDGNYARRWDVDAAGEFYGSAFQVLEGARANAIYVCNAAVSAVGSSNIHFGRYFSLTSLAAGFATATQGIKADTAVQPAALGVVSEDLASESADRKNLITSGADENWPWSVMDIDRNVALGLTKDAVFKAPGHALSENETVSPGLHSVYDPELSEIQWRDEFGFLFARLTEDGHLTVRKLTEIDGTAGSEDLAARDARNLAESSAVARGINAIIQRPTGRYSHFIVYGQSLSTGWESWPALSVDPVIGNFMLGDSERPADRFDSAFTPLGSSALNPLVAVVQSTTSPTTILTAGEVSALPNGSANEGESPGIGALNMFRALWLNQHSLASDGNREFVLTNCGVGGKLAAQLSKGAVPLLYRRVTDAATLVKAKADAAGGAYVVPSILFMQGEADYQAATSKATYKALVGQLFDDIVADVCVGIAGQTAPPAIFTYQTGGGWTEDGLAIGTAQFEMSEERSNVFLVGPVYPYFDKYHHLNSNSSRAWGMQVAKVQHRVLNLGQDWKPLHAKRMTVSGKEVLLDFHVPAPPLVFALPYVGQVATDYAAKGFRAFVDGSPVSIASVEIVGQTMVRITLAVTPTGDVSISYAEKTTVAGNGNLRDSDATLATEFYRYTVGSGQYAAENIPALVDKRYSLANWCVAFILSQ
jgi:hypothetical protein